MIERTKKRNKLEARVPKETEETAECNGKHRRGIAGILGFSQRPLEMVLIHLL